MSTDSALAELLAVAGFVGEDVLGLEVRRSGQQQRVVESGKRKRRSVSKRVGTRTALDTAPQTL